jgi:hypothetical protein
MSAVPELIIPMSLNIDDVLKNLAKVREEAGGTLDNTKKKTKDTSDEFGALGKAVNDAGGYLKSFVTFQAGLQAVHAISGAIADEMNRVAKNIDRSTQLFSDFRKSMIEYAAITGKPLNNQMVVGTIGSAKSGGVAPAQYVAFQKAMMESAGGNIGRNITQDQFDEVTRRLAPYMQARGLEAGDVAGLAGGIMRGVAPGTPTNTIMDTFGRLFGVLEAAPGNTKQLLPEMIQALASGYSPEDASVISAVMAENGVPRMTSTFTQGLARLSRQIHVTGEKDATGKMIPYAQGLGVTQDMTATQSGEQIIAKARAEGINTSNQTQFGVWLAQHGIRGDSEQMSLNLLATKGIDAGVLAASRSKLKANGLENIDNAIQGFESERVGREIVAENRASAAEVLSGEKYSGINEYLARAMEKYIQTGRDKRTTLGDIGRSLLDNSIFGTAEEQIVMDSAMEMARSDARRAGVRLDQLKGSQNYGLAGQREDLAEILRSIDERLAKANDQRESQNRKPLQGRPQTPVVQPQ